MDFLYLVKNKLHIMHKLCVILFVVAFGSSFGAMHAQEQADPWVQAFVKSLKKDDVVKTNGIKVGALRCAVPNVKPLAVATLLLSVTGITFSSIWIIDILDNLHRRSLAEKMTASAAATISVAMAIGSIIMMARGSGVSSGPLSKKPYIVFDEKGLVIDNKRVLAWSDIESIEIEKWPLSVCCTDQFGNDIKITSDQLAALPLTAKNIVALAKYYIAKAKVAENQTIATPSTDQPVPLKPVVQKVLKKRAQPAFMEDDDEASL